MSIKNLLCIFITCINFSVLTNVNFHMLQINSFSLFCVNYILITENQIFYDCKYIGQLLTSLVIFIHLRFNFYFFFSAFDIYLETEESDLRFMHILKMTDSSRQMACDVCSQCVCTSGYKPQFSPQSISTHFREGRERL